MKAAAFAIACSALVAHAAHCRAEEPTPAEAAEAETEGPSDAVTLPAATMGRLTLQPALGAGFAYFTQGNSWYGRSTANLGRNSDRWSEGYLAPGLTAEFDLGDAGRLKGGTTLVGAF